MNERSIVVFFDNFRVLDLIIQLDDLSLVGGLLVAGGVVFGVFDWRIFRRSGSGSGFSRAHDRGGNGPCLGISTAVKSVVSGR